MRSHRLTAYLDALVAGRRPGSLRADPEDAELLRTAIALRASQARDAAPDPAFVSALHQELAQQMDVPVAPVVQPHQMGRRRAAVVSIAAGVALVGGTVAVTEAISQSSLAPAAVQAPRGSDIRTGTFNTLDSQVTGQVVAYNGTPSWVFMKVSVPNYNGKIICTLEGGAGSTLATGAFTLHNGVGDWSKTIHMDIGQLQGARLVTSTGTTVATASLT
jgi:hypothetical protein